MSASEGIDAHPDAVEAARRGAAWMDAHHPGWADRIDLATLDMTSCSRCIVGQFVAAAYPWYIPAGWAEQVRALAYSDEDIDAAELGFDIDDSTPYNYTDLETAWMAEVEAR